MKAINASGIFDGVRNAELTASANTLELALDSWEAPIVFTVTAVDRDAHGVTVYRGTAPRAAGSSELIAIRATTRPSASRDAPGAIVDVDVTRSREGSAPDSVLELRAGA